MGVGVTPALSVGAAAVTVDGPEKRSGAVITLCHGARGHGWPRAEVGAAPVFRAIESDRDLSTAAAPTDSGGCNRRTDARRCRAPEPRFKQTIVTMERPAQCAARGLRCEWEGTAQRRATCEGAGHEQGTIYRFGCP